MQLKFKNPVRPDLTNTIQKRNRRLQAFFSAKNLDVRLHGDAQNPLMVLCGCVGLSSYVHNFDLRMLDKPNQGDVMKIYKLTEIIQGTREEVVEWIQQYPQMPLFRIQHKDSKLFLCGFNFVDREQKLGRYPVFAREDYHIYKQREAAEDILNMLKEDGYEAEITEPDLELVKSHVGPVTFVGFQE